MNAGGNLGLLVAERARENPDAPALSFLGREITYADLAQQAASVSRALGEFGDGPARAALFFEDEPEYFPALLGSLGAGYLVAPIDPSFPTERLRAVFGKLNPTVVLANKSRSEHEALTGYKVVTIEDLLHGGGGAWAEDVIHADDDAPATVLFTSGSTGAPKGVLQTHRNIRHHVANYNRMLGVTRDDRISLLFSYSFSASLMDIFGGFLAGACICPHYLKKTGLEGLGEWIGEQEITVYHSIPSVLRELLERNDAASIFKHVHAVDLAGEAVHPGLVERALSIFPAGARIVHHLACTECSVIAQQAFIAGTDSVPPEPPLPAGKPAPGVAVTIVDEESRPVQSGEPGELVIESAFLSPGYLDEPELTSAAFTDLGDGVRRYRTGDRARMDDSGVLHHLGRKDSMVKIRGHRVELLDVEAALHRADGVEEAVVTILHREKAGPCLIGWHSGPAASGEVRASLAESLPGYMIPAFLIRLQEFPRTSTGKIDRKNLPDPWELRRLNFPKEEKPGSHLEREIAVRWSRVLEVSPIGRNEKFLDLGGDSLSAVRLTQELEELAGRELPPAFLADCPTVVAQREWMESGAQADSLRNILPLQTEGTEPPIFGVHGSGGNIYHFRDLSEHLGEAVPFHGVVSPAFYGRRVAFNCIEQMAQAYCDQLVEQYPGMPYRLVGYSLGGFIAWEMACQLLERGAEVDWVLLLDPRRTFTPLPAGSGPISRLHRVYSHTRTKVYLRRRFPALRNGSSALPWDQRSKYSYAAHHILLRGYSPRPSQARASLFYVEEATLEFWKPLILDPLAIEQLGCDHQDIRSPERLGHIAGRMQNLRLVGEKRSFAPHVQR